jgi:2-polyprenyl-3-methyl-5-hydroxy-6-metoxy-1,4-benzoquinol methylase
MVIMVSLNHNIEWDDEKVSRLWDYYSKTKPYSSMYFSKVFGSHLLKESSLPLRESISVLDFGCGPGFIWEHINSNVIRWLYTGVDFSHVSIETLTKKAGEHEQFCGGYHVAKLPLSMSPDSFDAILLFEVVEHLNDAQLDATLREVSRLVKPGGKVVVSTPNEENLSDSEKFCPECGATFHEWQHVRSWSVSSLEMCFAKYGFNMCNVKTLDFAAQGRHRVVNLFKKSLRIKVNEPHMIAAFVKS